MAFAIKCSEVIRNIFLLNRRILFRVLALLFIISEITYASEPYFRHCDSVLESPAFKPLKLFYDSRPNEPRPDNCFRLNKSEFLVTVTNSGRIGQGLYFYDGSANSYELVGGHSWPDISIKREFLGGNQKRFVLINTSNLYRGNWEYGYRILYLVPGKKLESFAVKDLLFAKENPVSGFCGHESDGVELTDIATSIKGFDVVGEGSENVRVEFNIEEEDCKTGTHRKYNRVFMPQAGDFTEVE
ncbi:hypothetical protein QLH52_20870 [Methylomonas sp. OY6]|uniref:Secreted protein n=1 Tax=Methylomonas defluvii TaxID=3045149 RepID=A0ABU4ULP3_9GAMM|nr:hypothetical protein [Methylomonas sp. OY6]MDX8129762.1 hypothetical protein [Methylomonas sp. OY6]